MHLSINTGLAASALFAFGMASSAIVSAAGFNLTCQTLDPSTQLERNVFAPGESLAFAYSIEIPPEAADKEINLKLSARIRVGSIEIPYALDELKLSFPNQDFAPGGDDEGLPIEGVGSEQSLVDIPAEFPEGSATLRAKVSIEGVGKRSCEVEVEVVDPS